METANDRNPNLLKQFQEELNDLFCAKESWVATLPFPDVVGYNNDVDLFQFTDRVHKLWRFETSASSKVRFDQKLYPPSIFGLKQLSRKISRRIECFFLRKRILDCTLPFPNVVGYNNDVDLCQFTDRVHEL